jgi:predicted DNA binding protein
MTKNEQLTQPDYSEKWAVCVGKETFLLNEKQIKVLKEATKAGNRGIIWFDDFGISIPHIQSIYVIKRTFNNQLSSSNEFNNELTEEQRKEIRKRIKEIREKLGFILSKNTS